ncbi:oligopeptide/dipeptide ABC transporter ATP-binding protein [uncultured Roseobacter sp.]
MVEDASVARIFGHPAHPYTRGLLAAVPHPFHPAASLSGIPGTLPNL